MVVGVGAGHVSGATLREEEAKAGLLSIIVESPAAMVFIFQMDSSKKGCITHTVDGRGDDRGWRNTDIRDSDLKPFSGESLT